MMMILFLKKVDSRLIALLTGASGTLAFSPYNCWPCALFSLTGLLSVIIINGKLRAAWLGFIWGCGLFGTGISWIYICIAKFSGFPVIMNIMMILLIIVYLSSYPMLFSFLFIKLWPKTNVWILSIGAPCLWSVIEFCRSYFLIGFPWLQFGYSQIDGPLKGMAPILGVESITFIICIISGLLTDFFKNKKIIPLLISIVILLIIWPLHLIKWYRLQPERGVNVALVQGDIPISMKWDDNYIRSTIDIYIKNTLPNIGKVQLIIWPESAIPDEECKNTNFLEELDYQLRYHHTSLITGIFYKIAKINYIKKDMTECYNTILVLGDERRPYDYHSKNRYYKHHLVPFGESVPCKRALKVFSQLFNLPMSYLTPGKYLQSPLRASEIKFVAAICYEVILGHKMRDNFHPDTDFLLTISNNAWFGDSIGPWQSLQIARMRSLELGRPLLHCTNNGITGIITANGKLQMQLPQFIRDVLYDWVVPTYGLTPYAYFGPFYLWIIIIFTLLLFYYSPKFYKSHV